MVYLRRMAITSVIFVIREAAIVVGGGGGARFTTPSKNTPNIVVLRASIWAAGLWNLIHQNYEKFAKHQSWVNLCIASRGAILLKLIMVASSNAITHDFTTVCLAAPSCSPRY